MFSYFLVKHKYVDIFELDNDEWEEAIVAHPELLIEDPLVNFEPRSANAFIVPGKDRYFNNEIILKQF